MTLSGVDDQLKIVNIISMPQGGGAELLVRELHRIFQERGLDSKVIYSSSKVYDLDENEMVIECNPRSPCNIFRTRKILQEISKSSDKPLVVHAHLTWPLFFTVLATIGMPKISLFYTEHDTFNKRRKIPFFSFLERAFYRRFKRIICISHGVEKSLSLWIGNQLRDRMVTIPNGSRMYQQAQRLPLKERKARLVSIGSLTKKKNFTIIVRAITYIDNDIESYTVLGDGPERNYLEQLVLDLGLKEKVHLKGWCDNIEDYLHDSDIQLIPSLWEGFGLVAVEGLSTGIAVIGSNVTGLCEVLDKDISAVTLVDEIESPFAWANALKDTIKALRCDDQATIAAAARKQAEKFSLEVMADNYLQVYREL